MTKKTCVLFVLLMFVLLVGCAKQSDEETRILQHVKEKYPNDTFILLSSNEVKTVYQSDKFIYPYDDNLKPVNVETFYDAIIKGDSK